MIMPKLHRFKVACCGRRRGMLPQGILICSKCDYDHASVTVVPNENKIKDVAEGLDDV
jgi:hypothetical protein